jgi:maltose O-acetyltransferase
MRKLIGRLFLFATRLLWSCVYAGYRAKYNIHPTFKFNGDGIRLYGDGEITLGENSYIGRHSSIQCSAGQKVVIGKNCSISHYVAIYTENNIASQDFSSSGRKKRTGDVYIYDNCWIGFGVFIREGITIGTNAVVGANSVVIDDIPDHCIYAGVPARMVKKIEILTPEGT